MKSTDHKKLGYIFLPKNISLFDFNPILGGLSGNMVEGKEEKYTLSSASIMLEI